MLKKNVHLLLVSLLTLLSFLTLFMLRGADDNGLTSWQWVFGQSGASAIFLVISAGVVFLITLSKVSCSLRRPAFLLFLFSFIAIAPFWSEPEVIVDSARYFTQAKHLEIYGIGYFIKQWGRDIAAWTDMPLVPFLFGLIFRVAGEVRLYIQIFTTLLFSLTVVLTYLIGKELWDEEIGFYGGALLFGIPYLPTQASLMLVDVPTMFFLTFSIYAFIRALSGETISGIILAAVSIFLAFFSKYSTWPMLSVLAVIFLVIRYREQDAPCRSYLFRVFLVLLIDAVLIGAVVFYYRDVIMGQIRLLMSYQKPGLGRWGENFASIYFFQIHPFVSALALSSLWFAARRKDKKYAIISWLVLLAFLFHIKRIRYILPLFPMIALMASYGLQQIHDREIRRFIALCILLSSLSVSYLAYLPFTNKMSAANLKRGGSFLDTLEEKNVEVLTIPLKEEVLNPAVAVPLLDLYTGKRIIYRYDSSIFRPKEDIKTSPLRFTWEYKNPRYYSEGNVPEGKNTAIVVIGGELSDVFPIYVSQKTRDYYAVRAFVDDEGVFQFKTFVAVYRRLSPAK